MRIRILGAAAGGGLPQWNCRCPNCDAARSGSPHVRPRTQSSVAISADGRNWFLLNVSADVRAQLAAAPELWPPAGMNPAARRASAFRATPLAGCLLTDAEIDHASGLLQLREGCRFAVYSTPLVRRWLHEHLPIGRIVSAFAERPWRDLLLETPFDLQLSDGSPSGLRVRAFPTGREIPRYVPEMPDDAAGSRIGLEIEDTAAGGRLVYAPGLSAIDEPLRAAAGRADCVLIDGTFWSEDELLALDIGRATAREMGHLPVSGEAGTLAWLSTLLARHRVYVHINNTNPILNERSAEHRAVRESGVGVGMDGDEIMV